MFSFSNFVWFFIFYLGHFVGFLLQNSILRIKSPIKFTLLVIVMSTLRLHIPNLHGQHLLLQLNLLLLHKNLLLSFWVGIRSCHRGIHLIVHHLRGRHLVAYHICIWILHHHLVTAKIWILITHILAHLNSIISHAIVIHMLLVVATILIVAMATSMTSSVSPSVASTSSSIVTPLLVVIVLLVIILLLSFFLNSDYLHSQIINKIGVCLSQEIISIGWVGHRVKWLVHLFLSDFFYHFLLLELVKCLLIQIFLSLLLFNLFWLIELNL